MIPKCELISGWISGIAGVVVGHPMDTIKVRQQLEAKSIIETLKYITKEGGRLGPFRGMCAPLITDGILYSMFFGVHGAVLSELKTMESHYNKQFIAGCAAGAAQLIVALPVDVLKVQLQSRMQKEKLKGPVDCVKQIVRTQGIHGLYKGLGVQFLRDVPASGVYFVVYEYLKAAFSNSTTVDARVQQFLAGGTAGMVSWWVTLPLDVIKSRVQGDCPVSPKYSSPWNCARVIYKEGKIKGFFQGFWPVSLRAFPVNGTVFVVYEFFTKKCKDQQNNSYLKLHSTNSYI